MRYFDDKVTQHFNYLTHLLSHLSGINYTFAFVYMQGYSWVKIQ